MRASKLSDHLPIPPLRIRIFFPKERHAPQTIHQSGREIAFRQIAFESRTLLAIAIKEEHRGRPNRIKAVEPGWVFLYVSFDRKEVFMDEICSLQIRIRFGIQPSTGSSSRSRAEIQQNGAALLLRCGQSLIDILTPIHGHNLPPLRTMLHQSSMAGRSPA